MFKAGEGVGHGAKMDRLRGFGEVLRGTCLYAPPGVSTRGMWGTRLILPDGRIRLECFLRVYQVPIHSAYTSLRAYSFSVARH